MWLTAAVMSSRGSICFETWPDSIAAWSCSIAGPASRIAPDSALVLSSADSDIRSSTGLSP